MKPYCPSDCATFYSNLYDLFCKVRKASLFHSSFHSGTIFLWKKRCHMLFWGMTGYVCPFSTKKDHQILWCQIDFWSFATFFGPAIFWSDAKQRFCFGESMSVLDQNGRIQALGFLAWWQLTSHALNYNLHIL